MLMRPGASPGLQHCSPADWLHHSCIPILYPSAFAARPRLPGAQPATCSALHADSAERAELFFVDSWQAAQFGVEEVQLSAEEEERCGKSHSWTWPEVLPAGQGGGTKRCSE
eukprot:1814997-Rhodomonas_salina.1